MAATNYKKIQYKSDFMITIQCDAGWTTPFCIKFWTAQPGQGYFVGWDGNTFTRCKLVEDDPSKLLVLFDDHGLPCGDLQMQMAWHVTPEEFPTAVLDEVMNAQMVTTTIDDVDYQVQLAFDGDTAPELEYALPAYAAEAQRIANEQERQREFAEMQAENEAAVQGAERVNAELNGTTLTVTNRQGVSMSKNVQGPQGIQGEQGPAGNQGIPGKDGQDGHDGVGIASITFKQTDPQGGNIYTITLTNGNTYDFTAPRGQQGVQGPAGKDGKDGADGQDGQDGVGIASITFKETDASGNNVYTITLTNNNTYDFTAPRGPQGPEGPQGPPSPVNISVSGTVVTFTDNQGQTSTIDVADALAPIIGDINGVLDEINGEII